MIQAIVPMLFAMMCNSTQYEPIEGPTALFEQTELSVCLENSQNHKTYLNHVALYAPVNSPTFLWGSEMEESKFRELNPEFTLYWKERTVRSWGGDERRFVAHFVKDAETGHYNIHEASFLDACWGMTEILRINKNSRLIRIPKPISFEPQRGKFRYVGRSDNKQLLAVKVWKYVQKEREGHRRAKATGADAKSVGKRKKK